MFHTTVCSGLLVLFARWECMMIDNDVIEIGMKQTHRDARAVLWHSAAHCLGHAMEKCYGCHLTHGPPIEQV